MSRYYKLATGIIILLLLVACGEQASPTATGTAATTTNVLKVGVLAPLSGPSEATGADIKNAAIMAFETVDYTIGNYTLEPVWIDSQSNPEQAARAYETAIVDDGIQVGILNWHSSVSVSVMDVAAKHKIPHFFGIGATELINQKFKSDPARYSYWNFKGWPTPHKLSQNYVLTLESAIADGLWQPAEKQAALFVEDTDWGHSFGLGIKDQLEKAGWTVVATNYVASDETDFSTLLQDIKDEPVSLLVTTGATQGFMTSFINQVAALKLPGLVVADGLGWTGGWYAVTDEASDYVIDQIPGWTTEEAKAFAEAFEARWGNVPSPSSAGLSYDYTNFFLQILQATEAEYGELTSQKLYQFSQQTVQTGQLSYQNGLIMNEYKYTPETVPDPVVGETYYTFPVLQYFEGEGRIIWPPAWQETEFQAKQ